MEEPGRFEKCDYIIGEARKGAFEIWTSSLSLAEVHKTKCGTGLASIQQAKDKAFEDFLDQSFVVQRTLDNDVGKLARTLLRTHPKLKKPNDAIHLATAILSNVAEFHTTDKDDLLHLDGKIICLNGEQLKICEVPPLPTGTQNKLGLTGGATAEALKN